MAVLIAASAARAQHHGHGGALPQSDFPSAVYSTPGTVKEVNLDDSTLVVDHGPIDAVGWGPMTMGFKVEESALLEEVSPGDEVRLDIRFDSPTDYLVIDLEKTK